MSDTPRVSEEEISKAKVLVSLACSAQELSEEVKNILEKLVTERQAMREDLKQAVLQLDGFVRWFEEDDENKPDGMELVDKFCEEVANKYKFQRLI